MTTQLKSAAAELTEDDYVPVFGLSFAEWQARAEQRTAEALAAEAAYAKAREDYRKKNNKTREDRDAFQEAKRELARVRSAVRAEETLDPNHPRSASGLVNIVGGK